MSDTEMADRPTAEQVAQLSAEQRARITDEELATFTQAQLLHLLLLSPDQITQTLHPGAILPPPPVPQGQQQQPPQPGPPEPTHPLDPTKRPTPAQLAREEKNKKRKRDGPDDDAERANEIRSLVRLADNRHLIASIVPFDERPDAQKHTDYHVRFWKGDTEPCDVKSLPNFAVQATAVTLEDALAYNQSKNAWLEILRKCAADRDSANGFACIVQLLDKTLTFEEIPTMRERIQEAFIRMCHSLGIVVIAPQPSADARDGHPIFMPRSFLVYIPLECALTAAAGYVHHISWPEFPEGIDVTVLLPDHAPPTLVGSYENMRTLPTVTPGLESAVRARIQDHVASRFPGAISDFLRANNARLWGGGQLEPWWCELLQASIHIKFWEAVSGDKKANLTLSVYCLGVFDASWMHSIWEEALLGAEIDLGEYGVYKRTATSNRRKCSICHDKDHHARVCPVWHHPAWPEALRQRRAARVQAETGRDGSAGDSGSSRGRGRGRGRGGPPRGGFPRGGFSRGGPPRGGGHHHGAYGPPPPPFMYGYGPGYGQGFIPYDGYGYPAPPQGNGGGSGRGRGGRGW
ncbi:hypothetical protein EXIGLDRAFT_771933 [Exidia glandulosa HHB12029]|uniref:Uncharacterized protein n=1 Tax=Exidia glandulosa HHB12029 TaxID=1314781 RepID=A0A165FM75_EXIGL|nr:hypothetical protein EXIGLDRAFT_771933 [Exidia glandulosa HHB12029]